jgi:hypothetical protein
VLQLIHNWIGSENFPFMCPEGLMKHAKMPHSKARFPPDFRTENVQKESQKPRRTVRRRTVCTKVFPLLITKSRSKYVFDVTLANCSAITLVSLQRQLNVFLLLFVHYCTFCVQFHPCFMLNSPCAFCRAVGNFAE